MDTSKKMLEMSTRQYYEYCRKNGWTSNITEDPDPDYNLPFYREIFELMNRFATLRIVAYKNGMKLKENSNRLGLLERYSEFLQKEGYMDTDWKTEPPYAIGEFLKTETDGQA